MHVVHHASANPHPPTCPANMHFMSSLPAGLQQGQEHQTLYVVTISSGEGMTGRERMTGMTGRWTCRCSQRGHGECATQCLPAPSRVLAGYTALQATSLIPPAFLPLFVPCGAPYHSEQVPHVCCDTVHNATVRLPNTTGQQPPQVPASWPGPPASAPLAPTGPLRPHDTKPLLVRKSRQGIGPRRKAMHPP